MYSVNEKYDRKIVEIINLSNNLISLVKITVGEQIKKGQNDEDCWGEMLKHFICRQIYNLESIILLVGNGYHLSAALVARSALESEVLLRWTEEDKVKRAKEWFDLLDIQTSYRYDRVGYTIDKNSKEKVKELYGKYNCKKGNNLPESEFLGSFPKPYKAFKQVFKDGKEFKYIYEFYNMASKISHGSITGYKVMIYDVQMGWLSLLFCYKALINTLVFCNDHFDLKIRDEINQFEEII